MIYIYFYEIRGIQTVSMENAEEGFNPVHESEVQRRARILLEIGTDVESLKLYYFERVKYLNNIGRNVD